MLKLNDAGLPDLLDLIPPLDRLNPDKKENEELAILLSVLQSQSDAIAANIDLLYDNWFIESCSDWVVPYIAELLEIPSELADAVQIPRQRALVANTIAYRAYRGTARALECALQDATGWPVFLVEGLARQFTSTQHLLHGSKQPTLLNMLTEESLLPPPSPFNDFRTSYSIYQTPSSPTTASDKV
ncbi:MAG: phage tail protein, partial [Sneathiellales bacterium]|nr:phage tail protein [Sneathiellales bacterium]